ncbi:hypothetical protein [Paenibacillus kobensis]|uniref:hypothetical protein n=1 Tax=Paenibacillus kobensis TaxID=59841 RepID=UPI000FD76B35|nr:hypothetical protein [Paenibacillus kobensis]
MAQTNTTSAKAIQADAKSNKHSVSLTRHYMTIVFGAWLIGGIFVDGYAHNHGVVETFFTPWHAILYSGFLACALWMGWQVLRTKRASGLPWRKSVPDGYGLGLAGVGVFLIGGLCDMAWHITLGIEKNTAALLSPPHLTLLIGGTLILSSPFRAVWNDSPESPGWRTFAMPLLSVVLVMSAISFFLMYNWTFRYNLASKPVTDWYMGTFYSGHITQVIEARGLTGILFNTVQIMAPVLLLLRRWRLPFGALTILFGGVALMMNALDGFVFAAAIAIAAGAGLAADLLYLWLRPEPSRIGAVRLFALLVPIVLWAVYYAYLGLTNGIGWEIELWTGSIVEAALASLGLSLLAVPPAHRVPPGIEG